MAKRYSILLAVSLLLSALCAVCCTQGRSSRLPVNDPAYSQRKKDLGNLAYSIKSYERLTAVLDSFVTAGDDVAAMCLNKELGKRSRDASDFEEAVSRHSAGLEIARRLDDSLEVVTLLNQLGTDFRRMGMLDDASDCHYEALEYCEQIGEGKSSEAEKALVNSLNGLGNVYLELGNLDRAKSMFSRALEGEKALNSHLGMAINYANLGAIYETKGQLDSAFIFYKIALQENTSASSDLGIGLCYSHFGSIKEAQGQLDSSKYYYRQAYDILVNRTDKWHWLQSCISLAALELESGNFRTADRYISEALPAAQEIESWSHLNSIYDIRCAIDQAQGHWKDALESSMLAAAYRDSLDNERNYNYIQQLQDEYNSKKTELALQAERQRTENAKRRTSLIIKIALAFLLIALSAIFSMGYALKTRAKSIKMRARLEKSRQEFFTNVTHDFRTPLTVICGQADLICKNTDSPDDLQSAEAISRQGNVLLDLVNQLLEVSKVNSSIGTADWRRGDIVPLLSMAVDNARQMASLKLVDISLNLPESKDIVMDFVPDFVKKIMSNLLSNAVKYTERGGTVSVDVSSTSSSLSIKVADTGIGIAPEDLPNIFSPFYRAASVEGKTGTGIGLSLVSQMVAAMDGRIDVESTPGVGTVFTVKLPLKYTKEALKPYDGSAVAVHTPVQGSEAHLIEGDEAGEESISVLIVEDNRDISQYIGSILKPYFNVYYALNGKDGLAKAEEFLPDLIVSDLMMPEMDGYEMCRRIRSTESVSHIPVVVVTARSEEADRLAGIEAGADAFLVKPFNPDELLLSVRKQVENRKLLREKYSRAIIEGGSVEPEGGSTKGVNEFVSKLTGIVVSNLTNRDLSPDMIADILCMSRSTANRKIRNTTGMSTLAFITAMRISVAKKLLSTTDKSVNDISFECGFEYQSYFSRTFKAQTGLTPLEYRKANQ